MSNQKQNKDSAKNTEKIKRYGKYQKTSKQNVQNQNSSAKTKKTNAYHYRKKSSKQIEKNKQKVFASPVKIAFLGGLNEVGKNLTLIE